MKEINKERRILRKHNPKLKQQMNHLIKIKILKVMKRTIP